MTGPGPADHADRTAAREHRVDVGAVTLAVTEAGPADGPPVVLLHGFPDSRRMWRSQVAALAAAGHHVLAPDLRGFGDSDRPGSVAAYRLSATGADVWALLDHFGVARAAVVGHDWGAVLAWSLVAAHPERVERLAVVSVGHPRARAAAGWRQQVKGAYVLAFLVPGLAERLLPAREWWWLRRAWGGATVQDEPDLARQVADLSRPGALAAALAWYRANVPRPGRRRAARPRPPGAVVRPPVQVPVMGVWSSADPVLTEEQMTGTGRFVGGPWRYERIEGAGHWVPVQAADRLDELLVDFLA